MEQNTTPPVNEESAGFSPEEKIRLACMLDAINAMLPRNSEGKTTHAFVMVVAPAGKDNAPVAMFSNIGQAGRRALVDAADVSLRKQEAEAPSE